VDIDVIIAEMKKNPLLDGITLSGGEPFEQAEAFGELAEKSGNLGYGVMTYTGYTYETLLGNKVESWGNLLKRTDILVDGKFQIDQKSLLLKFKGSKNQRIIDVKKSLLLKNTVLREV